MTCGTRITCSAADPAPLESATTLSIIGSIDNTQIYLIDVAARDAAGPDLRLNNGSGFIRLLPTMGDLAFNRDNLMLSYNPSDGFAGTAEFSVGVTLNSGAENRDFDFRITVNCPSGQMPDAMMMCVTPPTTCPSGQTGTPPNCVMTDNGGNGGGNMVEMRRDSNDDFEKVGYAAAAAVIGSVAWNFYKIRNPGLTDRFNFTAMPTSNKSLQYNLSADINKNWSANFTVDKQVKINSDTTNSKNYKLEFKYLF